jgi:hypothetical protein
MIFCDNFAYFDYSISVITFRLMAISPLVGRYRAVVSALVPFLYGNADLMVLAPQEWVGRMPQLVFDKIQRVERGPGSFGLVCLWSTVSQSWQLVSSRHIPSGWVQASWQPSCR